jgi:hypothetical protein
MSAIKLATPSSGSISLSPANTASNLTITVPASTSTMLTSTSSASDLPSSINGPAFSAYQNSNQTITTSTWTKINFDTEEFDTNSNYNNATYRFTPTVAGYYQVNGSINFSNSATNTANIIAIYKNGTEFKRTSLQTVSVVGQNICVGCLIYMNGSTDYIECYGFQNTGSNVTAFGSNNATIFSASLVRSA